MADESNKIQEQEVHGTLEQFRSKLSGMALARSERFEIRFQFPSGLLDFLRALPEDPGYSIDKITNEMTLMAEEIQIPGMILQNKEVPIGAWNFMRNSNVSFLGNEINITFITDADWQLRHIFEAWIGLCVNPNSKRVAFPDDQYGQIWINALDTQDKLRTTWELMEVTPKVLNLIPMAMMGSSIVRTTLIISSAYWRSKTVNIDLNSDQGMALNNNMGPFENPLNWGDGS